MKYDVKIDKKEWEEYEKEEIIHVKNLPDNYKVTKTVYTNLINKSIWNVIKLKIYKNNKLLTTVNRNYPDEADSVYVKQNNSEYLITSGDYMCITVVNLTTNVVKSYTNDKMYKIGAAFCPYDFDYEDNTLIVTGCVWGGDEETYYFHNVNFNKPKFDF